MSTNNFYEELVKAYCSSFIDTTNASETKLSPSFLYNDKSENKKVITKILNELKECDSFSISVAFITYSGIQLFKETLLELKNKGIKGRILTTDYLSFTDPKALEFLKDSCPNIEIKMFKTQNEENIGFHTKGYIFKKGDLYKFVIGSSNITDKALTENKEWNVELVSRENSSIINSINNEFESLWNISLPLDKYIDEYKSIYKSQRLKALSDPVFQPRVFSLEPNSMQIEFLKNLKSSIEDGKHRALFISATGTGKTYACAFAIRELICNQNKFKRVLFLAHRNELLIQAYKSFTRILPSDFKYALLSGEKNISKEYKELVPFSINELDSYNIVFSTSLMMKDECEYINPQSFDFIVIDEVHKAGSSSYEKIIDHFKDSFILGMTATPERSDDTSKIYKIFNYNIVFELRLKGALSENLLCPFHYYGISDIKGIDDNVYEAHDFNKIFSDERINYILYYSKYYGYSGNRLKGLIFVSSIEEGNILENKLSARNIKAKMLSGVDDSNKREESIKMLEENDINKPYYDFLITRDIFNEGIDIPSVNQVILLRPTQSSIIFIQQLGRGLRKYKDKEFVVILDFIGDYKNNFMIPYAFSDSKSKTSTIKTTIIPTIPGVSTIEFDKISQERIFKSIQNWSCDSVANLKQEYLTVKEKIGRIPTLTDFIKNDFDAMRFIKAFDSYYEMQVNLKDKPKLLDIEMDYLQSLTLMLMKGLRIDEALLLKLLIEGKTFLDFKQTFKTKYNKEISDDEIITLQNVLDGSFFFQPKPRARIIENNFQLTTEFVNALSNKFFKSEVMDIINYSLDRNALKYHNHYKNSDFTLFETYERIDVDRLLNIKKQLNPQSVGGYSFAYSNICKVLPLFINYEKSIKIDVSTRYTDKFINEETFAWESKKRRKIG